MLENRNKSYISTVQKLQSYLKFRILIIQQKINFAKIIYLRVFFNTNKHYQARTKHSVRKTPIPYTLTLKTYWRLGILYDA